MQWDTGQRLRARPNCASRALFLRDTLKISTPVYSTTGTASAYHASRYQYHVDVPVPVRHSTTRGQGSSYITSTAWCRVDGTFTVWPTVRPTRPYDVTKVFYCDVARARGDAIAKTKFKRTHTTPASLHCLERITHSMLNGPGEKRKQ